VAPSSRGPRVRVGPFGDHRATRQTPNGHSPVIRPQRINPKTSFQVRWVNRRHKSRANIVVVAPAVEVRPFPQPDKSAGQGACHSRGGAAFPRNVHRAPNPTASGQAVEWGIPERFPFPRNSSRQPLDPQKRAKPHAPPYRMPPSPRILTQQQILIGTWHRDCASHLRQSRPGGRFCYRVVWMETPLP
jgi:hypothetical protein